MIMRHVDQLRSSLELAGIVRCTRNWLSLHTVTVRRSSESDHKVGHHHHSYKDREKHVLTGTILRAWTRSAHIMQILKVCVHQHSRIETIWQTTSSISTPSSLYEASPSPTPTYAPKDSSTIGDISSWNATLMAGSPTCGSAANQRCCSSSVRHQPPNHSQSATTVQSSLWYPGPRSKIPY